MAKRPFYPFLCFIFDKFAIFIVNNLGILFFMYDKSLHLCFYITKSGESSRGLLNLSATTPYTHFAEWRKNGTETKRIYGKKDSPQIRQIWPKRLRRVQQLLLLIRIVKPRADCQRNPASSFWCLIKFQKKYAYSKISFFITYFMLFAILLTHKC